MSVKQLSSHRAVQQYLLVKAHEPTIHVTLKQILNSFVGIWANIYVSFGLNQPPW